MNNLSHLVYGFMLTIFITVVVSAVAHLTAPDTAHVYSLLSLIAVPVIYFIGWTSRDEREYEELDEDEDPQT